MPIYLLTQFFLRVQQYEFLSNVTDGQTDGLKAMHMRAPCNMHRWAQKCSPAIDVQGFFYHLMKSEIQCQKAYLLYIKLNLLLQSTVSSEFKLWPLFTVT